MDIKENTVSADTHKNTIYFLGTAAIIVILILVVVFSTFNQSRSSKEIESHKKNGDWAIMDSTEYVRDGKSCIGYRIYVNREYGSEKVYRNIFRNVTESDGYYLHTVWIYNLKSQATGSHMADYVLEQTRKNEVPDPIRQ